MSGFLLVMALTYIEMCFGSSSSSFLQTNTQASLSQSTTTNNNQQQPPTTMEGQIPDDYIAADEADNMPSPLPSPLSALEVHAFLGKKQEKNV